ncbi:MAG: transposase [Candidatus Paceibacterota bacterium]
MGNRKQPLLNEQYYHVYNRGVDKRNIFGDKMDLRRFIESIKEFNQKDAIISLSNLRKTKIEIGVKPLSGKPLVAIVAYCLNPNHFHFILKQLVDGGIAKFMQKLQGGYTSYFNVKNFRSGSLFQGTFKAQHISSENYFNKTLGYVNKNYQIHNIPKDKKDLVFASDYEYENNNFKIVSKKEGERMLEIFGGVNGFKKHSDEIVEIIRKERGRTSLLEDEELLDRG